LIYQGCPQFLPSYNHNRIRWANFRWEIATWIYGNLELSAPDPNRDKRMPEIVLILGWKGAAHDGLYTPKLLDGKAQNRPL
jgi:hypothetical protein